MRGKFSDYVIWWIAIGILEVGCMGQPKCPVQLSGLLAHPRDCDKFLLCANGRTHIMPCDPGTVFNPTINACDAPYNVPGCEDEPPFPVSCSSPLGALDSSDDERPMFPYSGQIIRLRGGSSARDGYVEVQGSRPGWGVVCDVNNGWTIKEAHLICRQLGFLRGAETAWQGRPTDDNVPLWVAATEVHCFGNETKLHFNEKIKKPRFQTCKFIHGTDCNVERNAVGVSCLPNRVIHCRKDEVPHAGSCYHLADADTGLNYEEALRYCEERQSKLVDITNQPENDFLSEWLMLDHPEVETIMTAGLAFSMMNETIWIWEGSAEAKFKFSKWWPGWRNDRPLPPLIDSPSCIIMKKSFRCLNRPDRNCSSEYFFWDVEDCASSSKGHSYICKRPYDDMRCVYRKGYRYSGHVNVTASGKDCLPWGADEVADALMISVPDPDVRSKLKTHNYCRNPNPIQESRPWCFTGSYGEKEHCDIPACGSSVRKAVPPEVRQYASGNIEPGAGYSEDLQQVTSQQCYNVISSSTSEQHAHVKLGASMSFTELESALGISVSASGKYGMFSADAKADYLRSVKDNDYSISLNYYHYMASNVAVKIGGHGDTALTETGKDSYDNGNNTFFGLMCGDYYISSYEQGALLIMGLNIKLSSSLAKTDFEERAGAKFGDIVSASQSVKIVGVDSKLTGSVSIQAFQIGGNPSQLSRIFSNDSNGNYYALMCNLQAMNNCIKTASGLLNYAVNNFPNQVSFVDNTGVTPLGLASTRYDPIERLGLTPPPSLVTPEVSQYRLELSLSLKENEYYQQKLYPFFNGGYPVKLTATFIENARSLLSKADENVGILMRQHGGAADCFNFPEKCKDIKAMIDSQLQNIVISELEFLEDIKYIFPLDVGMLYNTGGNSPLSWEVIPDRLRMRVTVNHTDIGGIECEYLIRIDAEDREDYPYDSNYFCGFLRSNNMTYEGNFCKTRYNQHSSADCTWNHPQIRKVSPFFFELFWIVIHDSNVYQVINVD